MFNKGKSWLPGILSKPKNPHSLEHLKYLYNVLCRNQTVTEQNRVLLVETLRSISEILIWGDQNDSSVFDFFLEKNMLSFFLKYLQQRCGRYICVQLLQTLNILFENISNETSLYYLLSNNHINAIIVHKFDFSDEEVMAYYISFLKTLSLKLNKHTIHFFYNEHTNDFALYTEAIKFFNHSESMVRIAVRTITLNVYKVYIKFKDLAMLRYIRDRTAAPYFSNLVWFIGSHILDLDICVRNDADHQSRDRLADLVAEHLDHLHYVNDILLINIDTLNDVLSDQLLNRLLVPLYVYSLTKRKRYDVRMETPERERDRKHVSSVVSLFLLSQVFLIIKHAPLVRQLAEIIFQGDVTPPPQESVESDSPRMRVREFVAPEESLEETLDGSRGLRHRNQSVRVREGNSTFYRQSDIPGGAVGGQPSGSQDEVFEEDMASPSQNSTDEEKILSSRSQSTLRGSPVLPEQAQGTFTLENRPYLEAIFHALECTENDYEALFALCLLYAMGHNDGIHQGLMDAVFMPTERSETKDYYNVALVERLIRIITLASQHGSKVRLATLELSIKLLKQLVYKPGHSYLQDRHLASIENARECSTQLLRNFYKSEEIFLDMFEDEYREMTTRPLNVEYLTMDASILLPPTGTPLTGIEFNKRLPCGEVERARRAIRVFFLVRELSLTLMQEEEIQLPLSKDKDCVKIDNILDLNNSDLIACTVVTKERKQERRFLVIDALQMILVEPDTRRLGWGIVTFVGFLQNIEVTGDKEDSRSLHITVHKPATSHHVRPVPLLSARFIFDDHIRCMAAKQRLTKGRMKARQQKMQMIERLLDIPIEAQSTMGGGHFTRSAPIPGRSHPVRVSSSSSIERASHSRSPTTQSMSQDRLVDQSTHSSVSHGQSASQSVSQSMAHGNVSSQSGTSTPQRIPQRLESISVDQVPADDGQNQNENASMEISTGEIEVAEEATSEMAFQTLHQTDIPGRRDSGFQESSQTTQEIPLEDLSRKNRSKKKQLSRARLTKSRLSAELKQEQARSQSQSPKRTMKRDDTLSVRMIERVRSSSLTETSKTESHTVPTRRTHSDSSPLRSDLKPSQGKKKCSVSTQVQTKLVIDANIKHPKAEEKDHLSMEVDKMAGPSPKTLTPSQSPAVSLVPEVENVFRATLISDSPKLVPPVEPDRIRSLSDASMASSDETASMCSTRSSDSQERPSFGFHTPSQAEPELSAASVEIQQSGNKNLQATTDQLTKLAQMVQEHYKFDKEEETEFTEGAKK